MSRIAEVIPEYGVNNIIIQSEDHPLQVFGMGDFSDAGITPEELKSWRIQHEAADAKVAEHVKLACGGDITEVVLDKIHMGFVAYLNELGINVDTSGRIKQ